MRHVYIVTYDISDPKRLRRVYRTMRGFGQHLQLSVFQCDLTPTARIDMIAALGSVVDHGEDQVLIVDLGSTETHPIKQIETLGRPMKLHRRAAVVV